MVGHVLAMDGTAVRVRLLAPVRTSCLLAGRRIATPVVVVRFHGRAPVLWEMPEYSFPADAEVVRIVPRCTGERPWSPDSLGLSSSYLAERRTRNAEVEGSMPSGSTSYGVVAQEAEQRLCDCSHEEPRMSVSSTDLLHQLATRGAADKRARLRSERPWVQIPPRRPDRAWAQIAKTGCRKVRKGRCSTPLSRLDVFRPVAQQEERRASNTEEAGSSPVRSTTFDV